LRIVTALIFIEHGTQKLFGFPPPSQGGMPPTFSLLWAGGVVELVGGAAILVGFLTRPMAFLLSGQMAAAYWMFHAQEPLPSSGVRLVGWHSPGRRPASPLERRYRRNRAPKEPRRRRSKLDY
jgi:uncharacterized membrane protein YphA (DoxX/SURF4 family)